MSVTLTMLVACGPETGLGHLRRMQALARSLSKHGAGVRWHVDGDAGLAGKDAVAYEPDTEITTDILVVDGYHFDLEQLRSRFRGLMCVVDDLADRPIPADVVVNHNLYAQGFSYPQASKALLGPKYALIDPGFGALRRKDPPEDGEILVTLGGARRFCILAIELAGRIARETARTVGVAAPEPPEGITIPGMVRLECGQGMVELFSKYDKLVTGLGVSYLEALATGKPVYGLSLVDNQRPAFDAALKLGLPASPLTAPDQLAAAIISGLGAPFSSVRLIDGQGGARVAEALVSAV
jgi:spore coat polysaccharide biosynthesis predicted glycosyltransferase SpsG